MARRDRGKSIKGTRRVLPQKVDFLVRRAIKVCKICDGQNSRQSVVKIV